MSAGLSRLIAMPDKSNSADTQKFASVGIDFSNHFQKLFLLFLCGPERPSDLSRHETVAVGKVSDIAQRRPVAIHLRQFRATVTCAHVVQANYGASPFVKFDSRERIFAENVNNKAR
jgi:hypothetical protein